MKRSMLFALTLGLSLALSAPITALAAEAPGYNVVIGGRVRQEWSYEGVSKEQNASDKDITSSTMAVAGGSYLRSTFTSSDKKVGGRIEIGLGSTVKRRTVYGWYKIGNCTIVAGNNYMWYSEIVCPADWSSDAAGIGHLDHGRAPMISFEYEGDVLGLQVALREPRSQGVPSGLDEHHIIPGLTVSTKIKAGAFGAYPGFFITNTQWENAPGTSGDDSSNYWSVNLPVEFQMGSLWLGASLNYSVNVGYESISLAGPAESLAVPVRKAGGDLEDTTSIGGFIAATYAAGPAEISAGFGYQTFENSEWQNTLGYDKKDFSQSVWYVGCSYELHKYLKMIPEFSYQDYGDNPETGKAAGNKWVLGMRIEFRF